MDRLPRRCEECVEVENERSYFGLTLSGRVKSEVG